MPVATIDTFKRILLKPDNVTLEANVVGDSLSFVAGSGITLTANGNLDEITITNSASLGLVTLDNVLLAGNTSTRTATVGRLDVDNIVIDSNAIQFSDSTVQNTAWTGLPTASNSVLGGVKIDASSITINGGVISVPAVATIGQTNGIATLGSDGKLTSAQIPTSLSGAIIFKGTWNASTNTPTLVDGTGQNGWQYTVSVAGTVNLGSGSITFVPGDFIIYNGSIWQKIAANTIAAAGTLTGSTLANGVTASSLTSVGTLINLTVTNIISGSINGNAGTVTNGVYTTDTGTVTNTMLSGSIANNKLTNSSVTIGSTAVSLGSTVTTFAGLTSVTSTTFVGALTGSISGNAATVTNGVYTTDTGTVTNTMLSGSIANTKLTNSTISGKALGTNLDTLTLNTSGTGLSGSTTYNGSGAATFTVASNATSVNTLSTIVARDANGNFSAGTITATITGSVSGNAGTVTNGVVTTGSYADPVWITSLSASKVGLANVANESKATMFASPTFTGTVAGVTATHVGLGSVTNESKATMFSSPTFTGTVAGVTATHVGLGNVTNESKATMFASPTFTGTVSGVTKTHVGLGSVDNTADANKAVSSASTAGTATNHYGAGGSYIASSNFGTGYGSAIQVREAGLGGAQGDAMAYAPRLGFHWSGVVASSIAMEASGRIGIFNNPGTAYEAFVCGTLTASNFSGTSSGTNTGDQTLPTLASLGAAPTASPTFTGTVSGVTQTHVGLGSVDNTADANKTVASAGNATTAGGLAVATGRNNGANQIVRTDVNGYIQCGYINSSNGDENNASNPSRVWGTNGSDSYLRTYQTGSLSVNYATTSRRLARSDSAVDTYNVQSHWDGTYWELKGYNDSTYHAGAKVAYATSAGSAGYATSAGSAPASDVYAWAKAATAPITYTPPQSIGTGDAVQFGSLRIGATGITPAAGDIVAAGNITAYSTSDIRLKENIQLIPNALHKLEQIRGVIFDWTAEEIARRGGEDLYFVRKHDVGVIAQEVEMVLPEIVATRDNGMKAVQYEKLTALLIESVKELSAKVTSLEQQLNLLKIK